MLRGCGLINPGKIFGLDMLHYISAKNKIALNLGNLTILHYCIQIHQTDVGV